ncbi:putative serine/threonine-protein kinase isoform X1 [Solanum lycopersicum]|uniref:putative serine/threonine-protein kinase isoform X1 n=1 Tax=Solanum lycopersicum TaxID=4081 RepID=UPI000532E9F1|nr:putative serine/threonine-protein kinase isoform X1 [Solanum lycopersicum]
MKFSFPFISCFSSSADNFEGSQIPYGGQISQNFTVYSYSELKAATHGFRASNKIGEGGFGSVYKGRLQDGTFMAVKVLSVELESMRGEREFVSEIAALSDIKHENLVNLRGCCVDGAHRLLVYDYMENNSLSLTLLAGGEQNRSKFTWTLRKGVSIGIAKGLSYLHEEVSPHVVHRDIKTSNILLDENFTPKIADFGLARLFTENMSHISTRVAGTLGYLSPEYAISGHLTRKSDVYSFGVVLLEIVSGSPVVAFDITRGEHFLVNKAWEMYNADQLLELVDPVLDRELLNDDEALRFLKVGLLCVQENASLRPKMSMVIKMLSRDGAIIVDEMKITQPGIVADLMDVKIGRKHSSQSFFSKASTSMSPGSPFQIVNRRKSNS